MKAEGTYAVEAGVAHERPSLWRKLAVQPSVAGLRMGTLLKFKRTQWACNEAARLEVCPLSGGVSIHVQESEESVQSRAASQSAIFGRSASNHVSWRATSAANRVSEPLLL